MHFVHFVIIEGWQCTILSLNCECLNIWIIFDGERLEIKPGVELSSRLESYGTNLKLHTSTVRVWNGSQSISNTVHHNTFCRYINNLDFVLLLSEFGHWTLLKHSHQNQNHREFWPSSTFNEIIKSSDTQYCEL